MTSTTLDLAALQRRTVRVLIAGQILGGLGIGATLSIGSVLAAEVSGSEAWAGSAATLSTLGAAAVAIPLGRLTRRHGRRVSLALGTGIALLGAIVTVAAAAIAFFPLMLLGFAMLGSGAAVGLQSRFAATDVADPRHRGRDLSIVVWSATVGSVVGPNLFGPGEVIATWLRMPPLTGSFVIAVIAQLAAVCVYAFALKPDPYLVSQALAAEAPATDEAQPTADSASERAAGVMHNRTMVIVTIGILGLSHATMIAVMSMTPVHLVHHGTSLAGVGLTLSLHIAGMFALSPVFGWLSDTYGRYRVILLGQAMFAISLVIVALGEQSMALVTVGLIFLGLGWSASTVSASALLGDLVTGAARPIIQGRSDLVMNLAGAVGGAAAGPALALVGYPGLAASAGVLVAAVVVAVVTVGRPSSRTRTA
ncbi:MFS family permease [Okibacterium sp. HSC-33S16]|uniref:MFS transporter n=1 Tax=Okibacterium sp. HSC-33S16 TaxID=2910965 RepID=UPI0020A0247C|nr:MFS transporter [Okibacterium sp. HSC-33S16]MCP2031002.1 MFS family permease [Okibacterium sp. HSC-33S16]